MGADALSEEFKSLYDEWGDAIARKRWDWFDRHFAEDFHGTAQPWRGLSVDKAQMIELDKAIETMEVEWLQVEARRFGDTVLATGVVRYQKEQFRPGATIAEGMPTGDQLSALVNGKSVLYIGAWRHNGKCWQVYDHHMIGIVEGFSP
ncbi:MAG TPA: hypothetical protein VMT29_15860 [Steroidobacteraceae bacterium]|nr:hypothetical protein [Steroidobacteraceae bacterium]